MNCQTWCARDCHQKCRFHCSCLMGSYPRCEWYHDCPHWKCQSRHCLPIHQTFLSVTVLPLKRGGKRKKKLQLILPGCAIHLSGVDGVRYRSVCKCLDHPGLERGLARHRHVYCSCTRAACINFCDTYLGNRFKNVPCTFWLQRSFLWLDSFSEASKNFMLI